MAKEENIKIANSMLITNSKGITLVALVVTIVILLILADPHIYLNIPQ